MVREWKLIQQERTGCGICADVCPHDAILMARQMAYPEPVVFRCVVCMMCVEQCPFGALEVNELSSAENRSADKRRQQMPGMARRLGNEGS